MYDLGGVLDVWLESKLIALASFLGATVLLLLIFQNSWLGVHLNSYRVENFVSFLYTVIRGTCLVLRQKDLIRVALLQEEVRSLILIWCFSFLDIRLLYCFKIRSINQPFKVTLLLGHLRRLCTEEV